MTAVYSIYGEYPSTYMPSVFHISWMSCHIWKASSSYTTCGVTYMYRGPQKSRHMMLFLVTFYLKIHVGSMHKNDKKSFKKSKNNKNKTRKKIKRGAIAPDLTIFSWFQFCCFFRSSQLLFFCRFCSCCQHKFSNKKNH